MGFALGYVSTYMYSRSQSIGEAARNLFWTKEELGERSFHEINKVVDAIGIYVNH